jgi:hypothetical protein
MLRLFQGQSAIVVTNTRSVDMVMPVQVKRDLLNSGTAGIGVAAHTLLLCLAVSR